jgi:DNA-nicking Smr family endonuclease
MNDDDIVAWKNLLKTVTPLHHRPMLFTGTTFVEVSTPLPIPHAPSFERQRITNTASPDQIIPPRVKRRLGTKAMPIEATLDLHGLTLDKAYQELEFFIKKRSMYGNKVVLIITGKGRGSPKGHPTIKQQFKDWIDYLKPFVVQAIPAHQRHGGEGAFYLLLRRLSGT